MLGHGSQGGAAAAVRRLYALAMGSLQTSAVAVAGLTLLLADSALGQAPVLTRYIPEFRSLRRGSTDDFFGGPGSLSKGLNVDVLAMDASGDGRTTYVMTRDAGVLGCSFVDTFANDFDGLRQTVQVSGPGDVASLSSSPRPEDWYLLEPTTPRMTLWRGDVRSGVFQSVGVLDDVPAASGFSVGPDGYGYTLSTDDDALYRVDLDTAVATSVGPVGFDLGGTQELDFDPTSGALFSLLQLTTGSIAFCRVDPGSGLVTILENPTSNPERWLFTVHSPFPTVISTGECAATVNSTGEAAELVVTGTPAVNARDLELDVSSIPAGAFGLFLASADPALVPGLGGGAGVLCLGGQIGRFLEQGQIRAADDVGRIVIPLDPSRIPAGAGFAQLAVGATWRFQTWYRDVEPSTGLATSNLSTVAAVTFDAPELRDPWIGAAEQIGGGPAVTGPLDVDDDGDVDLLVADQATLGLGTLLNDGRGALTPGPLARPGFAGAVAAADLDGDGLEDLLVRADGGPPLLLRGLGDGLFSEPMSTSLPDWNRLPLLVDYSGDGELDAVRVGPALLSALGNGDGTFSVRPNVPVSGTRRFVATGGFSPDPGQEIVTGDAFTGAIHVLDFAGGQWTDSGPLLPPSGELSGLVAFDADGDGLDDLVAGIESPSQTVLRRQIASGGFGPPEVIASGESPELIAPIDIDGDGDLDVFIATRGQLGRCGVLMNDGNATYGSFVDVYRAGPVNFVDVADFDGDGIDDLVLQTRCSTLGCLDVHFGDRVQGPATPVRASMQTTGERLYAARLNQDAFDDLVAVDIAAGTFEIALGSPQGLQLEPTIVDLGQALGPVEQLDADGDGDLDLVALTSDTEEIIVLRNGGQTGALDPPARSQLTSSLDLGELFRAGDIDGDGDFDLVVEVASPFRERFVVFEQVGPGSFVDVAVFEAPERARSIALGDVTRDGRAELVAGMDTDVLRIYGWSPAAAFTEITSFDPLASSNVFFERLRVHEPLRPGDFAVLSGSSSFRDAFIVDVSARGPESPVRVALPSSGQIEFVGDLTREPGYEFFTSRLGTSADSGALWAVDDSGEARLRFAFEGVDSNLRSATYGEFDGEAGLDIAAISVVSGVHTLTLLRRP